MGAQQAFRAQANVVSVKSGSSTPGTSSTPSMRTPKIPQGQSMGSSASSIVARNVTARPIEVKKDQLRHESPHCCQSCKGSCPKKQHTYVRTEHTHLQRRKRSRLLEVDCHHS